MFSDHFAHFAHNTQIPHLNTSPEFHTIALTFGNHRLRERYVSLIEEREKRGWGAVNAVVQLRVASSCLPDIHINYNHAMQIVRNPRILLLDEATASLDSINEHKIQTALTNLMQGRTSIIIAHRTIASRVKKGGGEG